MIKGEPWQLRKKQFLRALVGNLNLTVISNNCWGAHIYQELGISYTTPFVGLFILPSDYLRLLMNFERNIAAELEFSHTSWSETAEIWRAKNRLSYPIGRLAGEVEIHFQHYRSEREAQEKWYRRRARMTNRFFFKFDDREGATAENIAEFVGLPYEKKVCFSVERHYGTVPAPVEVGKRHVVDGQTLGRISRRYFNTLRWVSTAPTWLPLPSLL